MRYMGSKNRIAKYLLPIMLEEAKKHNITTWVEPFVGGANMIDKVPKEFKRIGYDFNPHTIQALLAVRDLVDELPEYVDEECYKKYREQEPDPIASLVRFIASFGGKFDGGFARSKDRKGNPRDHWSEAVRNAKKQSLKIQGVELKQSNYIDLTFSNCLIYCDPPYKNTTGYKDKFNHDEFYKWCKQMKLRGNLVFISEYDMPREFKEVWSMEVKSSLSANGKTGGSKKSIEKLFTI